MCSFGAFLNPAGAIGKAVGGPVGKLIDPAGTVAKTVGGPAGVFIDPAGAAAKAVDKKKSAPAPQSTLVTDTPALTKKTTSPTLLTA